VTVNSDQGVTATFSSVPVDTKACDGAKAKLDKAKRKLHKLREADAPRKAIKKAKDKVKKRHQQVEAACG
jgi:hypothetical protein